MAENPQAATVYDWGREELYARFFEVESDLLPRGISIYVGCRIGDPEFDGLGDPAEAQRIAEKIAAEIERLVVK